MGAGLSWQWERLPRARREDLEWSQLVQLICRVTLNFEEDKWIVPHAPKEKFKVSWHRGNVEKDFLKTDLNNLGG